MSKLLKSKMFLGAVVASALAFAGTAGAAYMHTTTLKMGSNNAQVMSLQQTLNATACKVGLAGTAGGPGSETMYFGAKTKAAVMCFQAANGLTADGIVGPMTGAALGGVMSGNFPAGCTSAAGYSTTTGQPCNAGPSAGLPAGCSSTAGYSPLTGAKCDSSGAGPSTGGPLQGGAGSITVDDSSEYSSEEVGEGEEDVEVLQFSVEADDESDVEITSVKVEFVQGTAADSEDLTDYASEVTIWLDGEMVGSSDAEDFSENADVWTKSISLDGAIVRAGDEEDFVVAVSALNNLDSGDIDTDAWTVDVLNVRFEDGEGVVTTEDTDADALEKTFDFASFATAADVGLVISLGDDEVNDAHVINVDDSDTTDEVSLLSFEMEAEGSDITVDGLPVLVTTTETTGTDPADLIATLYLYADGEKIGTESMSDAGDDSVDTVVFDDLDYTIEEGDTIEFIVKAKLKSTGSTLDDGDTVQVTFGETQTDLATFDAEDQEGEELADADVTGTAAADAHAVYDVGFNLDFVSSSETVQTNETTADVGVFVIKYEVTAFDGDIYIDNTCVEDNNGSEVATATSYSVSNDGSNATTCVVTSTGDTDGGTAFLIEEGTSETITLTVSVVPSADSFAQVKLEAIGWDDAAGGDDNVFDFDLPGDFETDPAFLNFTA